MNGFWSTQFNHCISWKLQLIQIYLVVSLAIVLNVKFNHLSENRTQVIKVPELDFTLFWNIIH